MDYAFVTLYVSSLVIVALMLAIYVMVCASNTTKIGRKWVYNLLFLSQRPLMISWWATETISLRCTLKEHLLRQWSQLRLGLWWELTIMLRKLVHNLRHTQAPNFINVDTLVTLNFNSSNIKKLDSAPRAHTRAPMMFEIRLSTILAGQQNGWGW